MSIQFLSNEKGKTTAVLVPIKEWEEIQSKLTQSEPDFMEELPNHVVEGIKKGQRQSEMGETKDHDDVMKKYSKYL